MPCSDLWVNADYIIHQKNQRLESTSEIFTKDFRCKFGLKYTVKRRTWGIGAWTHSAGNQKAGFFLSGFHGNQLPTNQGILSTKKSSQQNESMQQPSKYEVAMSFCVTFVLVFNQSGASYGYHGNLKTSTLNRNLWDMDFHTVHSTQAQTYGR